MPKLYLVRHGRAEAGWDEEYDPGLDDLGRDQAKKTARALADLGPLPIISSPLARALETSAPLAQSWGSRPWIEKRVGEIPSPTSDLIERSRWLAGVMSDKWSNLGRELHAWRQGVIEALSAIEENTVVFSHFIAINVAVGEATRDARVVCFWPNNGSVTIVEVKQEILNLISLGVEAATVVG